MKKILLIAIATMAMFSSCEDDIDVDGLLSYPPTVMNVTPKTSVKIGDFTIKVVLADGPQSPLANAVVVLKDANGTELYSVTETLSGIMDSVVIEGSAFNAAALPLGDYSININATDTRGNATESTSNFKVANQLYAANQAAMYIAGAFNGWGATELELVADNLWEVKEIDLQGGPFKFKNTEDWTDVDWGDSNCDKIVEVTTGGGANTECGYSGLVNVTFNDESLRYTVEPSVDYATNLTGLYLLGSFNMFQGPEPQFTLIEDNIWELAEIRLGPGDTFKFAENPFFEGKNYGDEEMDGKAELFGPNIVLADDFADAYYKITFNDKTRVYAMEVVRYPFPTELFLVGGSTKAGWTPGDAINFVKLEDGKFEIYAYLTQSGGGFKFLQEKDWAGDWGKGAEGEIVQEGENNVEVASDGVYRVHVDFTQKTYNVTAVSFGVVGSATAGAWETDTDMTYTGGTDGYTWEADITLADGEFKFRANDSWDINLGKGDTDGTLKFNTGNIVSPGPGDYHIVIDLNPVTGYTYTVTPD